MTTHTDLIARLREGDFTGSEILEAADALESLDQQVAALTKERDALQNKLNAVVTVGIREREQLAAANAREAKLRDALEKLKEECEAEFTTDGYWNLDGALVTRKTVKNAEAVLALPTDDSALMERLKQERERCAKVCEGWTGTKMDQLAAYIRSMT